MHRTGVLLGSRRLTFGQRWKRNRVINSFKNHTNYNPHLMIYQCDTLEKINEIQKLINKQKQVVEKKMKKEN
jgi:hypothetical protein